MSKKNAISVKGLTKIFREKSKKSIVALNELNLEVKQGEIFGLLGPNGAGKTTFINILSGTVLKTVGNVNVWGFDLDKNSRQVRASIGIVPQEVNLDAFFNPKKLLELQAGLYGVPKKDRITDLILKMVSLEEQANTYARSLSGGMKRRLLIGKAMVHQPPILVLDEPTAGVDVQLRQDLWALDTTKNLLNSIQSKKITFKVDKFIDLSNIKTEGLLFKSNANNEIIVTYEKKRHKIEEIINIIKKEGVKIIDLSTDDGDLEDVFIQLTKN